MNIFILDGVHEVNARYYVDKHIVKQISEHFQMLATAVFETTGETFRVKDSAGFFKLYPKALSPTIKPTHKNHPCTVWVRQSRTNFLWLLDLTYAMHDEWIYRFGHDENKVHASLYKFMNSDVNIAKAVRMLPDIGLTEFAQAMPEEYKREDTVQAYRLYYNKDKRHLFSWTKREVPEWIKLGGSKND